MRSLSANPWLAACQLWCWLWFRPSAWRQLVADVDDTLSPAFALAELNWQQWRHPSIRRLLLAGYFVTPATLLSLTLLCLALLNRFQPRVLVFMSCGLGLGLLFGLAICAGAGLVLTAVLGVAFAVAWGGDQVLLVDLLWGNYTGILLGLPSALAMHIIGNLTAHSTIRSVTRQTGSVLITLLVSAGVAALILGLIVILFQIRTAGGLPDTGIGLATAAVPALIIGWSITWRSRYWGSGLVAALLAFFVLWLSYRNPGSDYGDSVGGDLLVWIHTCSVTGIYFGFFAFAYIPIVRLATPWVATIAGSFSGLAIFGVMKLSARYYALWPNLTIAALLVVLGFTMRWWRPLLCYPFELLWNTLLLRLDEERTPAQVSYFAWNAVFWDELQFLPLYQLDTHLVLLCERNPAYGQSMLVAVSATPQRWAALAAQMELDVRRLEACTTVQEMASVKRHLSVREIQHPAGAYMRTFALYSGDMAAALAQFSLYNQRLGFNAVEHDLNNLARELLGDASPYARRFQPLVAQWQQILNRHSQELAETAELRQEIPNPYVVGVPLTRQQEIFVGRTDISRRIEAILHDQNHPPLLLYGQRRMGKTSLLYNLRWMLPHRILPLLVDLQGPVAQALDHGSFLYNLAKGLSRSVQDDGINATTLTRDSFQADPFTIFDDWLDDLEQRMVEQGRTTLLLALDEFEALDIAFASQRLNPDAVLGTLRHIIQHRPRFKLLLAGSHTLDEFQPWASYLINAQTIHLSYLCEQETRQLIERPMQNFPLAYTPEATHRVFALTRGHPYLVQLLCSEIVIHKNAQEPTERRQATLADVEATLPLTLARGHPFFTDIAMNQVDDGGRRLLHLLARLEREQGADRALLGQHFSDEAELSATLASLVRRELLEEVAGRWRFQVALIQQWFSQ
jgi:hypothetical protein